MPIKPKEAQLKTRQYQQQVAQELVAVIVEEIDDLLSVGVREWMYDPIAREIPEEVSEGVVQSIAEIYRRVGWEVVVTDANIMPAYEGRPKGSPFRLLLLEFRDK